MLPTPLARSTSLVSLPLMDACPKTPAGRFACGKAATPHPRLRWNATPQVIGKPKVSVTFALSPSGLIDVTKAEAAIEMLEKYEELVPTNGTLVHSTLA